MNKPLLMVMILIALGVVGLGGYFALTNKTNSPTNSTQSKLAAGEPGSKKSFKDLMGIKDSQMCTFKDEMQNSGTVYAGGGKFRADFSSTSNGQVVTTHLVSDTSMVYLWFDGSQDGFKMSTTEIETHTEGMNMDSLDINKQADYECSAWTVDDSKFVTPTTVTFQDFSAMMKAMPEGSSQPSSNSMQCAACNNLPDEAAMQCKQALNCI